VLLVYDITCFASFRHLDAVWIEDLKQNLPDAVLILVGNKVDIEDDSRVKNKR